MDAFGVTDAQKLLIDRTVRAQVAKQIEGLQAKLARNARLIEPFPQWEIEDCCDAAPSSVIHRQLGSANITWAPIAAAFPTDHARASSATPRA